MSYIVYILESGKNHLRYIGSTQDIISRLKDHNEGRTASTRGKGPWKIIYTEELANKSLAEKRERFFKSGRGKEVLKNLIPSIIGALH